MWTSRLPPYIILIAAFCYSSVCLAQQSKPMMSITPNVESYSYTVLYDFEGPPGGAYGASSFIQASDGNLYGTTGGGANDSNCPNDDDGCGTIFKITPTGIQTLYNFCNLANCADGVGPGYLIQGNDGDFYGVTEEGGVSTGGCPFSAGCGTVFKITPAGALTTLYTFCDQDNCTDGEFPRG